MAKLSQREHELLQYLADGKSLKLAAAEMGIAHQTMKNLSTRLKDKLNAETSAHAVAIGMRQSLID